MILLLKTTKKIVYFNSFFDWFDNMKLVKKGNAPETLFLTINADSYKFTGNFLLVSMKSLDYL